MRPLRARGASGVLGGEVRDALGERREVGRPEVVVELERRRHLAGAHERLRRHDLADRRDREPVVRLEHVEVVHAVAEVVAVLAHAQAGRLGDQPERGAVLAAALERAQTQLGVGLGDRAVVAELRRVLDAQDHCCCCICWA